MAKALDVPDSGGVSREEEKKPPSPTWLEWRKCERQRAQVKRLEAELAEAMDLDEGKVRKKEINEGVEELEKIQQLIEDLAKLHRDTADLTRDSWETTRRPKYVGILVEFLQRAARSRKLLAGDESLEMALDTLVQFGVRAKKAIDSCGDSGKGQAIIAGFISEAQALVGRKQPKQSVQPDGEMQSEEQPPERSAQPEGESQPQQEERVSQEALQPIGVIPPLARELYITEYRKREGARRKKQEILARGDPLPRQYAEILEELKGFLVHDVVHHRFWSDQEFSGGKKTVSALAESVIERLEAVVPEPGKPSGTFRIQELDKLKEALSTLTDRMESQLQRKKKRITRIVEWTRTKIGCSLVLGSAVAIGGGLYYYYSGGPKDGPPPADAPSNPDVSPETQLDGGISVHRDGNELVFKLPKAKIVRLWIEIGGKKQKKVELTDVAEGSWKYPIPADARPGQKIQVSVDIKGESGWVTTNRDYTEVQAK